MNRLSCVILVAFAVVASAFKMNMKMEMPSLKKAVTSALAGLFAAGSLAGPAQAAQPLTKDFITSLSYEQVKGSGLANRCPQAIASGTGSIAINGKYKLTELCIEPTSWEVEEVTTSKGQVKKDFVKTKLMTRQTYTLAGVGGNLENVGGKATFFENDGIDYAPTTVQTPGGERVPFLFTVKDLVATGNGDKIQKGFEMGGPFTVPSYRTGLFLDPKGRGTTTGYDQAGALPGIQNGVDGDEEMFSENNKVFDVLKGDIEFAVDSVDEANGDFSGVFVSNQPGDTDMGGKKPKTLLIKGIFSAHVDKI